MTTVIGALRVTLGLDSSSLMAGLAGAQKSLSGFGNSMRDVGADLSLRMTAPLTALGVGVLAVAGNFEAAMNRVEAATGASGEEMKKLSDLARELGKTTTFSAGEAADAVEMLAKNGLDASQILGGALTASLSLAAAGGGELSAAADLTTDVLANFKKDVSDLAPVVNGVTGVLLQSKFGFADYQLALAQAGGVAGGLGVTFEDFNAVIAATSPAFASGSDAGTSFKTFLQRLVPASDDAAAAMEQLGLDFFDAQGNMLGMGAVAQELQDSLAGLSDEAKTEALTTIFGTDAMRTAIGLMDQGAAGVERLDTAIRNASASEQAAARTKGFMGELEQLKGAIQELGIAIASSGFLEWATQLAVALTDAVDWLSEADPAFLKFGAAIGIAAAALGPLLAGLGLMAVAVGAIGAPVALAIAGIVALTAGVVAFWPEIIKAKDAIIQFATEGVAFVTAKFTELQTYLSGLSASFMQIGRDIIDGLMSGLREKWEGVKAWFTGLADSIPQWVREKLGIQSPSTVFAEIGGHIMDGLRQGLGSETGTIKAEMESFATDLGGVFANVLTQGGSLKDGLRSFAQQTLAGWGSGLMNKGLGGLGAILKIPGFASGTNSAPGGLAMVGERGRELVNLPRGSQVFPHSKTMSMLRGGGQQEVDVRVSVDNEGGIRAYVNKQTTKAEKRAVQGSVNTIRKGDAASRHFWKR